MPEDARPHVDPAELVRLFHEAGRLMRNAWRHPCGGHAQAHVLSLLHRRGGITQRELLDLLDIRSASLSELLGKLERAGLIARRRDETDRRGFALSLTEAGSAAAGPEEDRRGEADALFAGLDEPERDELGRLLGKLVASLAERPCGRGGACGRHAFHRRRCGRGRREEGGD